jgi:Bax protein
LAAAAFATSLLALQDAAVPQTRAQHARADAETQPARGGQMRRALRPAGAAEAESGPLASAGERAAAQDSPPNLERRRRAALARPQLRGPAASLRTGASLILEPHSTEELTRALERAGFRLASVRKGDAEVPRLYVAALPPDLGEVSDVELRKRVFLRTVLPLVLLANEEIAQRRARLLALVARHEAGLDLSVADRAWLDALADLYDAERGDFATLKARVAEIPPSLALAQSIVESGWGTSRFAREGNALFGQRVWSDAAKALVPSRNRSVRVQAFLDLMDSVRSYMHNLNTHPAYAGLRAERARLAAEGEQPAGAQLVHGLEDYAELEDYVAKLRQLMRHNKLAELDAARLASRPLTAALAGR